MRTLLSLFLIVITFFTPLVVPTVSIPKVYAQVSSEKDYVDRDYPDGMDAAKDKGKYDMNKPGNDSSSVTNLGSDLIRRTVGPVKGVTTNSDDQAYLKQMYNESFAAGTESIVTYVFTNPPASTYAFVRDMGETLGFFPKTAYAQGIGFSGLTQLLPMWKAFRNIAYLILSIFMIIIGFLIMFRKKIDPKTVVTVQNALPNIVVTLLLITFSYAIVGLCIDFMYLIIMIAFSILQPLSNGAIDITNASTFVSQNYMFVVGKLLGGSFSVLDDVAALFGSYATVGSIAAPGGVGFLAYLFTGNIAAIGAATAVPLLLLVILILAFIIAAVRLLFLLISTYIQIIMALLISPFQLLLGAFPGSHAFEGWIKNLIANLAVFPITAIMLLIGTILVKGSYGAEKLWGPPFLTPAGTGGVANGGMGGIIGLGILFAIPTVAGSLKEVLKAKPMINAGPGAVLGPIGGAVGQTTQALYQISMIKNMMGGGHGAEPQGRSGGKSH